MTIKEANKIYCVGIGGIGVSALARMFLGMGKSVAGSDLVQSSVTKNLEVLGVKILIGQDKNDILSFGPDLIVYSSAAENFDWPDIPKLNQAKAIGELMLGQFGIGVTGTNGKSTTTALLGLILDKAGLDPSVLIGSLLSPLNETEKFKANARLGGGKPARHASDKALPKGVAGGYFLTESDEYQRKMLENKPQMILVTNIALDHLDYYKNLDDIKSAFLEYINSLPPDGILIYNADDHNAMEVCKQAKCHKFTFGIHHYADLQAINRTDFHLNDKMIGKVSLQVPGLFNISNALAASLAALKLGVTFEIIQAALQEFAGTWRRFEKVGKFEGKEIISDYGHHPDAITGTIEAVEEFYPGKKILWVFQPHHRNRTKELFENFVKSLEVLDDLIIPEIFDVSGRELGEEISSKDLVEAINKEGSKAVFTSDLTETEKLIRDRIKDFDVVILMGAGDIDNLARKLVK